MISFWELIDLVIMTGLIGFIFKDFFAKHTSMVHDPLDYYRKKPGLENFKFAVMVAAPAVILHEMAHKFVALAFGINAVFHAAYAWLGLGVILKLMNFGFIFFVPGYVSHAAGTHLQNALISLAGPLANLILWLGAAFLIKKGMVKKKFLVFVHLTSKINMFLFFFNMLPIPPFDGFGFLSEFFKTIF